jgi:acyl-CoA thioester hydrolase
LPIQAHWVGFFVLNYVPVMRIKIEEPEIYFFSSFTKIKVSDLNYGNHLSNDKVLAFVHQARVELFQSWGFSELDFGGSAVIMTDAAIVFLAEGKLNDEIRIDIGLRDMSRVGFDLCYRLQKTGNNELLAMVKTGIVCFDYQQKKVLAIPVDVKSILTKAMNFSS